MSGYERMLRALDESGLKQPRGLWERLMFPMLRSAFRNGFAAGYAHGHIDGQHVQEESK